MSYFTEILIELYRRRDYTSLGLFHKQVSALDYLEDDETNELLYGGAARGGKSVLGCRWQIMRRLSMPESFGFIARQEYSKLRDTTIRTFFQECKNLGLKKDIDYKTTGIPLTVEFANGSVIYFREIKYIPSDPEFDRLGSYDLTDAFLDESQQIHWKAIQVLKGRFSVVENKKNKWTTIPKSLFTCNPAKSWVFNDFVAPAKKKQLPKRRKFIAALPSDNPHVPQSFFDNLMTADETTKQRLLYGNFEYDDDPTKLCEYDAICDIFTNTHIKKLNNKKISADLAMQGRDRFVAGLWYGMYCTIPIDSKKNDAKYIESSLNILKDSAKVGNSNIVADSDGLGQYLSAYIKNIKEFHGGARANNKEYYNLKAECAFKLAELINNREIFILCTKEQEEIIKTEISTCLKRDNLNDDISKKRLISKDRMKELSGHSPDYLDMLIMRMIYEVKGVRAAPIIYN